MNKNLCVPPTPNKPSLSDLPIADCLSAVSSAGSIFESLSKIVESNNNRIVQLETLYSNAEKINKQMDISKNKFDAKMKMYSAQFDNVITDKCLSSDEKTKLLMSIIQGEIQCQ